MSQQGRACLIFLSATLCYFFFPLFVTGEAGALAGSSNGAVPLSSSFHDEFISASSTTIAISGKMTDNSIVDNEGRVVDALNSASFSHPAFPSPKDTLSLNDNLPLQATLNVAFLDNGQDNIYANSPKDGACPLGGFHPGENHSPQCEEERPVQKDYAHSLELPTNEIDEAQDYSAQETRQRIAQHGTDNHVVHPQGYRTGTFQGRAVQGVVQGADVEVDVAGEGLSQQEGVQAEGQTPVGQGRDLQHSGLAKMTSAHENWNNTDFADGERGTEFVDSLLAEMSLAEKVGQLIMVGFRGTGQGPDAGLQKIMNGIHEGKIGGVILFDYDVSTQSPVRNIVSIEQVAHLTRQLQKVAPLPLFVGIDQEGERVARLKSTHGMAELASPKFLGSGPVEASFETYSTTAQILAEVGVNVNFAPSVDVDVDPLAPAIGKLGRSYSAEPEIVALHAEAFASALEKHGLMAAFKHFPGHGSAANDTHLGLADVTETWEGQELEPYRALLPKHPQAMVMVGHVFHKMFDETYPASLSKNIITGILRKDIGWEGLVVTDDLDMQAISNYYSVKECAGLALNAGVDILLFGNNLHYDPELSDKLFQGVMDLIEEGEVLEERIDEACGRVLRAKYNLYPGL